MAAHVWSGVQWEAPRGAGNAISDTIRSTYEYRQQVMDEIDRRR